MKPEILCNEVAERNHELLKEIVRQYGQILNLLTTTMVYIPKESKGEE